MNENVKLSETLRANASGRGMGWLNLMADKAERMEKDIAAYKGMGDKYEKEIARKDAAIAEQARKLQAALARAVEVTRERDAAVRDIEYCINYGVPACNICASYQRLPKERGICLIDCNCVIGSWRGMCAENGGATHDCAIDIQRGM